MLLVIESFRNSQPPKYPLKLYQKCARASLNIKDSRPWKGSLLQPGSNGVFGFSHLSWRIRYNLIFMSSSFSPKLQNNHKFYLLLNICMKIALPFADPVLSLLQTHRMAGISFFYFPYSAMSSTWRQQTKKTLPRKQIILHNFWWRFETLLSWKSCLPSVHTLALWLKSV